MLLCNIQLNELIAKYSSHLVRRAESYAIDEKKTAHYTTSRKRLEIGKEVIASARHNNKKDPCWKTITRNFPF